MVSGPGQAPGVLAAAFGMSYIAYAVFVYPDNCLLLRIP